MWSEGAHRQYGYESAEMLDLATWDSLHTPEDIAAGLPQAMRDTLSYATANGKAQLLPLCKNGSRDRRFTPRSRHIAMAPASLSVTS